MFPSAFSILYSDVSLSSFFWSLFSFLLFFLFPSCTSQFFYYYLSLSTLLVFPFPISSLNHLPHISYSYFPLFLFSSPFSLYVLHLPLFFIPSHIYVYLYFSTPATHNFLSINSSSLLPQFPPLLYNITSPAHTTPHYLLPDPPTTNFLSLYLALLPSSSFPRAPFQAPHVITRLIAPNHPLHPLPLHPYRPSPSPSHQPTRKPLLMKMNLAHPLNPLIKINYGLGYIGVDK